MAYPYRDQQYHGQQQWYPQQPYDPRSTVYYQNSQQYPQNQHYQRSIPFPVYRQQPHQIPYTYDSPPRYPASQPNRGRDYLASLSTSVNNLSIGQSALKDKPLPSLPPPEIPTAGPSRRPASLPTYAQSIPPLPTPPAIPPRPITQVQQTPPKLARKSFVPSFHPHRSVSQVDLLRPPELVRPQSDSVIPISKGKGKSPAKGRTEIDLTLDSDEESPTTHRRRAISEIPRTSPSKQVSTPRTPTKRPPGNPAASPLSPHAVRCSGYTRSGQPCKRVVKSTAPFLLSRDINLGVDGEQKEERYCKDHAGRICQVGGFYWKGGQKSVWVDFDGELEFI
jgi:hypothetical protein